MKPTFGTPYTFNNRSDDAPDQSQALGLDKLIVGW